MLYIQLSNIFRHIYIELIKCIVIHVRIRVTASDSIRSDYFCNWYIMILDNEVRLWATNDHFYHCFYPSMARMRFSNWFYFYFLVINKLCNTVFIWQRETDIGTVEFSFRIPTKNYKVSINISLLISRFSVMIIKS